MGFPRFNIAGGQASSTTFSFGGGAAGFPFGGPNGAGGGGFFPFMGDNIDQIIQHLIDNDPN